MIKLELFKFKEEPEEIRLNYWDSLHGDDVILKINKDNQAFCQTYIDEDGNETFEKADLFDELSKIVERF